MTGKAILEALSYVDERYIDEAEAGAIRKPKAFPRLLPLAACLCLVVFALYSIPQRTENAQQMENEAAQETLADMADGEAEMIREPDQVVEEVPSVILRLDRWDGNQFTATVVQLVDTDLFPVGTQLNVILKTNPEMEQYNIAADIDIGDIALNPGDWLQVQFYKFDEATSTIWVDWLRPYEEEIP